MDLVVEDKDSLLAAIRAEELLRANIAEANYKAFLSKQSEYHGGHDSNDMELLAMEAVTNTARMDESTHGELEASKKVNKKKGNNKKQPQQQVNHNEDTILEC